MGPKAKGRTPKALPRASARGSVKGQARGRSQAPAPSRAKPSSRSTLRAKPARGTAQSKPRAKASRNPTRPPSPALASQKSRTRVRGKVAGDNLEAPSTFKLIQSDRYFSAIFDHHHLYFPQLGDDVVYFAEGHEEFHQENKDWFDPGIQFLPFLDTSLPKAVKCRVVAMRYEAYTAKEEVRTAIVLDLKPADPRAPFRVKLIESLANSDYIVLDEWVQRCAALPELRIGEKVKANVMSENMEELLMKTAVVKKISNGNSLGYSKYSIAFEGERQTMQVSRWEMGDIGKSELCIPQRLRKELHALLRSFIVQYTIQDSHFWYIPPHRPLPMPFCTLLWRLEKDFYRSCEAFMGDLRFVLDEATRFASPAPLRPSAKEACTLLMIKMKESISKFSIDSERVMKDKATQEQVVKDTATQERVVKDTATQESPKVMPLKRKSAASSEPTPSKKRKVALKLNESTQDTVAATPQEIVQEPLALPDLIPPGTSEQIDPSAMNMLETPKAESEPSSEKNAVAKREDEEKDKANAKTPKRPREDTKTDRKKSCTPARKAAPSSEPAINDRDNAGAEPPKQKGKPKPAKPEKTSSTTAPTVSLFKVVDPDERMKAASDRKGKRSKKPEEPEPTIVHPQAEESQQETACLPDVSTLLKNAALGKLAASRVEPTQEAPAPREAVTRPPSLGAPSVKDSPEKGEGSRNPFSDLRKLAISNTTATQQRVINPHLMFTRSSQSQMLMNCINKLR